MQDFGQDEGKPAGTVFSYTHQMQWDAKRQALYYIGAGHLLRGKFLCYEASTNSWSQREVPPYARGQFGPRGVSHTYENLLVDSGEDLLLRQSHGQAQIDRYDLNRKEWIEPIEAPSKGGHRSATAYFPEWKTYVRLEANAPSERLKKWDKAAKNWAAIASPIVDGMGKGSQPVIEYNPVHKIVVFGGGNDVKDLAKLDAEGRVTALAPPPVAYLNSTHVNLFTADPGTGELLLITAGGSREPPPMRLYAYDVKTDAWRKVADRTPLEGHRDTLCAQIPGHGVVMFLTTKPEQIFLYKHAGK